MNHEDAIDKVLKLLRLAKSDNANEAALAAATAQSIIDKYKLDAAMLEAPGVEGKPDEPINKFEAPVDGDYFKKLVRWRVGLAQVLADANQCRLYTLGGGIHLIGRPSDAETVRYLFQFLAREVERLATRDAKGNGRVYVNNYRLGVIDTIKRKLKEQREMTHAEVRSDAFAKGGESAIVRVNQAIAKLEERTAEVVKWEKQNMNYGGRKQRWGAAYSDHGARAAGRKAGDEIRIGGAKAALGDGQ